MVPTVAPQLDGFLSFGLGALPASGLTVAPTVAPAGATVTLTLTGAGTTWTAGTPGAPTFLASAGAIVSQAVSGPTTATLVVSAPAFPPPGQIVTLTDPSTGAAASLQVVTHATHDRRPTGWLPRRLRRSAR